MFYENQNSLTLDEKIELLGMLYEHEKLYVNTIANIFNSIHKSLTQQTAAYIYDKMLISEMYMGLRIDLLKMLKPHLPEKFEPYATVSDMLSSIITCDQKTFTCNNLHQLLLAGIAHSQPEVKSLFEIARQTPATKQLQIKIQKADLNSKGTYEIEQNSIHISGYSRPEKNFFSIFVHEFRHYLVTAIYENINPYPSFDAKARDQFKSNIYDPVMKKLSNASGFSEYVTYIKSYEEAIKSGGELDALFYQLAAFQEYHAMLTHGSTQHSCETLKNIPNKKMDYQSKVYYELFDPISGSEHKNFLQTACAQGYCYDELNLC